MTHGTIVRSEGQIICKTAQEKQTLAVEPGVVWRGCGKAPNEGQIKQRIDQHGLAATATLGRFLDAPGLLLGALLCFG